MNALTNATSPNTAPALPDAWAERIFQRMENFYLSKWVDSFGSIPRERVKQAWAEELAEYTADEIKRGLEACRTRQWPPTLPEFLLMCRPVLDAKSEWAEACEQMRIRLEGRGQDRWTRPQVYWAAVSIGAFDLNNSSWDQVSARWKAALATAKTDPVPEYRAALPAPGKQVVTRGEAKDRMAEIRNAVAAVGTTKSGTKWAYALMEREANGEALVHIAAQSWREVLGYPADMDARKALEAVKAKVAA